MCSLQAKATAHEETTKSHYRGVRKRSEGRFSAQISDKSKRGRISLGTFSSDIEAAHAYDWAARAIKGYKAKTNFPLSPYQILKPVQRISAYKNSELVKDKVHVPSWINSNMIAKAATRPWTNAYFTKSFNVGTSSSSSLLKDIFPPELQRQQQFAALKMSNRARCNENEGDGGVEEIHEGCKESYSPCNTSDPSSFALTECRDSPIIGVLDLNLPAVTECRDSPTMGVLDLNLPAPVEGDECGHSRKTLWLFK